MTQPTSDKPAPTVETARPAPATAPATAPAAAAAAAAPLTPPVVPPPQAQVRAEPRRPGKFRRFVRSVFSHLIFAALVTAAVFGYVYQDVILGRVATTVCGNDALGPYAAGGSKSVTTTPIAKAPATVAAAPAPVVAPPVVAPPAVAPPVVAPKVTATPDAAPSPAPVAASPAPAPAPATKSDAAPPQPSPAASAQSADAKPATASQPASKAAEPPKPAAPVASAPAADTAAPASKPSPAASTAPAAAPDKLAAAWRAAREAFNAGKPDAIDAYKSLMRSYPDVPDLAGELGNIYYSAGKWREAGETYYEAAQRYLKSPQPGYAACLLDVLRNLRSPEAERLAPQITRPCPAARTGQTDQTASSPPRG